MMKKSSFTLALKSELTFAACASLLILLIIVPLQPQFLLESDINIRFFWDVKSLNNKNFNRFALGIWQLRE